MKTLITNAKVVNERDIKELDLLVEDGLIAKIEKDLQHKEVDEVIDAENLYLFPGVIDDQVHFREPGLTQKATIASESQAAVAGGITSFMEMPNVVPPTTNMEAIKQKISIAEATSFANYSFYIGATNNNINDLLVLVEPLMHKIILVRSFHQLIMLLANQDQKYMLFDQCYLMNVYP